ncbi:MAG TPA: TQO small subunit DoxD [Acidisoma sp.]|uniref:TQO small subunit DoxD n=1 Tax=Acidisoma sp. TaxID=1872115 RepID=UPI002C216E1D|nr:TQO small subunit DoxD [Acidisoma sp.]HTI01704.1 TQO small subunit DoxD [Acidisoma sp.]
MTSTTFGVANQPALATDRAIEASRSWHLAGMAMLATRLIQGFIYWGGGSRRFIYAPSKLDAWGGHNWMANKFQTAMPGALFGTEHVISYLLQHFDLLYAGVILFSAAELIAGVMLMSGLLTRLAALLSMGFSVLLMAMFGWQGATCIDEWTMAACNLAMGTTLLLGGASAYSLDNVLLGRHPSLADRAWFRWMGGSLPLPIGNAAFGKLCLALVACVLVYNVGTYSYYRGSVLTPFHGGPVSPTVHHVTLTDGLILPDRRIRVHAYLDAGTPEAPLHIVQAAAIGPDKKTILAIWDDKALSHLSKADFANDYAYNKFGPGPFGIRAPMGAKATIILPLPPGTGPLPDGALLKLTDVDGHSFTAPLHTGQQ